MNSFILSAEVPPIFALLLGQKYAVPFYSDVYRANEMRDNNTVGGVSSGIAGGMARGTAQTKGNIRGTGGFGRGRRGSALIRLRGKGPAAEHPAGCRRMLPDCQPKGCLHAFFRCCGRSGFLQGSHGEIRNANQKAERLIFITKNAIYSSTPVVMMQCRHKPAQKDGASSAGIECISEHGMQLKSTSFNPVRKEDASSWGKHNVLFQKRVHPFWKEGASFFEKEG